MDNQVTILAVMVTLTLASKTESNGCLYKGDVYHRDQRWNDGCSRSCQCLDDKTGLYRCTPRCPAFKNVSTECKMVPDPQDPCCKTPHCTGTSSFYVTIQSFGQAMTGHDQAPNSGDLKKNIRGYINIPPQPAGPPPTGSGARFAGIGYCTYKGKRYLPGETWEDGCDYNCVCDDARYGHYKCDEKCLKYTDLPQPFCYLVSDPVNSCCKIPFCNFTAQTKGFTGAAYPRPSTNTPKQTTTIATPEIGFCTYKGKQYLPGETWEDGCDYNCVCDDAKYGHYKCVEKCFNYANLSRTFCHLITDPFGCCKIPFCNFTDQHHSFTGQASLETSTKGLEQTTTVSTPDLGKTCFSCLGVKDIKCTVKKTCQPDETCFLRKYVAAPADVRYDMDCMPKPFCEDVLAFQSTDLRKRNDEMVIWNRCCEGSNCNKYYDTAGVPSYNGLRCPQCEHVTNPSDCKEFAICDYGQECFAGQYKDPNGNIAYRLDCGHSLCPQMSLMRPGLIGRRESRHHLRGILYDWSHCCTGSDCTLDTCKKHVCVTPTPTNVMPPTVVSPTVGEITCSSCTGKTGLDKCRLDKKCKLGQECYIEKNPDSRGVGYLYNTGCADKSTCTAKSTPNGSTGSCFECCTTSFCNFHGSKCPVELFKTGFRGSKKIRILFKSDIGATTVEC